MTDHPDTDLTQRLRSRFFWDTPDQMCHEAADALDACHTRCADLEAALRWVLDADGVPSDVGIVAVGPYFLRADACVPPGERWVLEPEQDT